MAKAPPQLVSENGRVTVKTHTRTAPAKKQVVISGDPVPGPGNATAVPARTVPLNPVDAQVAAAQLPAIQQIQAAQAASKRAAQDSATTTQGYYAALADALKGVGPAVQSGYQQAAGSDAAFSKGFSDGLSHVQSQVQDEGTQAAAVSGGAAPPAPTGAAHDALYGLGLMPASTMTREGAAFGAAADMLPATAAGQGASTIAGIGHQQVLDQQALTTKLADLAAQVPGLREQYQARADAQTNANRNFKLAQAKANADDVYRTSMLQMQYIAATGVDPKTGKLTPKAQLAYDKAQNAIDVANNRVTIAQQNADAHTSSAATSAANAVTAADKARGYWVDAAGNPHATAGNTLNADGTVTKNAKPGKFVPAQSIVDRVGQMRVDGYDNPHIVAQIKKWHPKWTDAQIAATLGAAPKLYADMTKTQVASLRQRVASFHTGFTYNPTNASATIQIGGVTYKKGDQVPPVSYGTALTFMIAAGYSRIDATAMLNRFYPKGKRK